MLSEIKVVITKIANENQGAVTNDLLNAFGYYPVPEELSQWMDEQNYVIKDSLNIPNSNVFLTHEQELYLIGLAQNGDMNACWQLLSHFDNYIKSQVSYYTRFSQLYVNNEIDDIIQDVYLYVIEHINNYRIDANARFATYLEWTIKTVCNMHVSAIRRKQGEIVNTKYEFIINTILPKLHMLGYYEFSNCTTEIIEQIASDYNFNTKDVTNAINAYNLNAKNKDLILNKNNDSDNLLNTSALDDVLINACTVAGHPLFKAYLHIYNNMLTPYEQNLLHFANVHYDKYNANAKKDMYTKLAAKYQDTDLLSNKHAVENLQYKIKSTLYKIIDADSKRKMLLEYAKEHNANKDIIDSLHVTAYKKTFMDAFNCDIDNYADALDYIYDTYASDEYKASH